MRPLLPLGPLPRSAAEGSLSVSALKVIDDLANPSALSSKEVLHFKLLLQARRAHTCVRTQARLLRQVLCPRLGC